MNINVKKEHLDPVPGSDRKNYIWRSLLVKQTINMDVRLLGLTKNTATFYTD